MFRNVYNFFFGFMIATAGKSEVGVRFVGSTPSTRRPIDYFGQKQLKL